MEKKIIRLTPDQLGYKDRGKMKWLGLMLSDHTEALSKMTKEERLKEIEAKPQQSLVEISELLSQAYHTGHPVLIQANILQNGTYFKDVPCMVSGTFEERIYLTSSTVISLSGTKHHGKSSSSGEKSASIPSKEKVRGLK